MDTAIPFEMSYWIARIFALYFGQLDVIILWTYGEVYA